MSEQEFVIEAEGLEVSYLIQRHGMSSLKQYLFSLGRQKLFENKSILKGIDLKVRKGETLGLLGRNGSGKSTLLKVLAGVIQPDEGTVKVVGRVAPLLALGVGLEPELTGMENIRLCATLMGLSRKEIRDSLGAILEFSELGKDINMQVKRYSSGMMSRLAFSISVAVRPDILIIDEVLSVGDVGFQQKCAKRIDELKKTGTTILFVSHSHHEIERICDTAAYLKDGKIVRNGPVKEVIQEYLDDFN